MRLRNQDTHLMKRKFGVFLGIVLFFVIGFLILGSINRSINLSGNIHIQKPVKEVFSAMVVPVNIKRWLPNLEDVKAIHGSMDTPGNQFQVRVHLGKKNLSFLMDVTDFQIDKKVEILMHLPHMETGVAILYNESDHGTEVAVQTTISGKGIFWRSALILFWPEFKHRLVKSLESLKLYVETNDQR